MFSLIPPQVKAAIAIALAVALFAGGWWTGSKVTSAGYLQREARAEKQHEKDVAELKRRGDDLSAQLEESKRNVQTVTIEKIKEVPRVTRVYVEKPGDAPVPIPHAVITRGLVRLWNGALAPGLPAAAGEPADQAGGSGDPLSASGLDVPDLAGNAVQNFGQYAECRAQLNALIDYVSGRPQPAQRP